MRITGFFFAFLAALVTTSAAPAADDQPQVLIQTSLGDITLQLDRAHAPASVDNFLHYAGEGHYDGTVVYRVVPGFVIQAGSYEPDFHQRPVHDPIALEANNGLTNVRGSIAMARQDDPSSATAEFFIDLADNPALDHQAGDTGNKTGYAVFGHVVSGMDVVDKIAAVPLSDRGPMPGAAPAESVVIKTAKLLP
jgi:cyclophilin family peptidyl-prolyl cis-trans isomerase